MVERKPSKLDVAGSSPVSRFGCLVERDRGAGLWGVTVGGFARVAQLAEHTLGKGEVIGSIPIASLQEQGVCGGTVLSRVSVPRVGPFITQESR